MEKSAVYHISEHNYSYAIAKDTLRVRIKVKASDCDNIRVLYKNLYNHTDEYFVKDLGLILSDNLNDYYETDITIVEKHFKYYFELTSKGKIYYYTADGFLDSVEEGNCFYYPVINDDDIISLPKWSRGSIIYQVLIDRFYDGDSSNNPPNVKKPEELPDRETYYGGDFEGLIAKLDYIKDLGAECLYLSPLFLSPTYHKYDIQDYYKIEDIYGGEDKLKELVDAAHSKGIRVVLDAVFNHCSSDNELFQDVIAKGKESKYSDWFIIDSFPVSLAECNYDTFAGLVNTMPRFNTANIEVINYLIDSAIYWTKKLNIDGWRLDVADEVSHRLWREFRRRIKEVNEEVLIIGEVWNHATKWLQGDEFDTVTNYKYRKWMLDFAKGMISSSKLWDRLQSNKALYKTPINSYMVNLLGSHDTIRSATYLKDNDIHILCLMTTLLMDGMPLIYYGDEIALHGQEDPDNRRAMRWDYVESSQYIDDIKKIGQLRANNRVLKEGEIRYISSEDRVLIFERFIGDDKLTIIANYSDNEIEVSGNYNKVLFGEEKIINSRIMVSSKKLVVLR